MTLYYQKELFYKLMPELPSLFLEHYEEVALDKKRMKLDPAWDRYVDMEIVGQLHVLTARVGGKDGELVGYVFNITVPHLHYASVLCAWTDMFFIRQGHRNGGWEYLRMFKANRELLKILGVKKVFIMTKVHRDFRAIMKRLKYKFIERIFSVWID